jgi:hypothetical protein
LRLVQGLSGLLAALALPCPALAQDIATAEALFNRGRGDMALGRYESGCKAIAESQRLDPRPGTLFTLAVCETRWGRIATAAARYSDYLSLYERLPKAEQARQKDRAKEAKAQRAALSPLVPELTLVLPKGAPAGTVVQRDGTVMADAALGVGLPVDPGEHVVTTEAPGRPTREQRISIAKGEKKQLVLELAPAPAPETAAAQSDKALPPEKPARSDGRRYATYVIGGIGVAGLVLGGVMGGLALGKKGTVTDHCGSAIAQKDKAACDSIGFEAVKAGRTVALVSTVGLAAGGAAIGTAVVLLLTEPKRAKPKEGSSGGWRAAPALQVGSDGALVGVRGIW